MSSVCELGTETLTSGSTYTFKLKATKNGQIWDLTGAVVTLKLKKAGEVTTSYAATLLDALAGTAAYDTGVNDLSEGDWEAAFRVQQGSIDVTSVSVEFSVIESP